MGDRSDPVLAQVPGSPHLPGLPKWRNFPGGRPPTLSFRPGAIALAKRDRPIVAATATRAENRARSAGGGRWREFWAAAYAALPPAWAAIASA
ncbi:hypothetical protein [Thermoleptolyngbya sp.]